MKVNSIILTGVVATTLLVTKASNAYEFGGIHEQCEHLESFDLSIKVNYLNNGETEFSSKAYNYGTAIGATNVYYKNPTIENDMEFSNVEYYKCPDNCEKIGATKENNMLGKENLLTLIGHEPIPCYADLVVSQLLQADFDNDGFMGYAIRYKTVLGTNQGQRGHLHWNVGFIKNSNGEYTALNLEDYEVRSTGGSPESYYTNISINENTLTINYLLINSAVDVNRIEKTFHADGNTLVLLE